MTEMIPPSGADMSTPAPVAPLDALTVVRRSGTETFTSSGQPFGPCLTDFWSWAYSDLVSNATRGVLAEYLVASALGITSTPRTEWDACDLRTPSGRRIEVKSAAYLQSWKQSALSTIQFSIRPARGWDAATNTFAPELCRSADLYVFCLLAHTCKATIDPLNVDQWKFYVLPTTILDTRRPSQKMISLSALLGDGAREVPYAGLGRALEELPVAAELW